MGALSSVRRARTRGSSRETPRSPRYLMLPSTPMVSGSSLGLSGRLERLVDDEEEERA